MTVGALSAPFDARISPIASGWPFQSTTSHSPPAARMNEQTHSPARTTSSLCSLSALIDGMRISSASSSNQSGFIAASLPFVDVLGAGHLVRTERELECADEQVDRRRQQWPQEPREAAVGDDRQERAGAGGRRDGEDAERRAER